MADTHDDDWHASWGVGGEGCVRLPRPAARRL